MYNQYHLYKKYKENVCIICSLCKGNLEETSTTYMTSFNGFYIIIKNVPCKKCTQCGEEYLNGVTMKKIETIISRLKDLLTEVAIVDYNHAA